MWNSIIGQDAVIEKLKSIFTGRKIAHAYLFEGTEGVGKDAAAIEFAKLLNCTDIVNGNEACGKCSNCRKITEFRSEYFRLICALPAGKSDETNADPVEKLSTADFDAYMEEMSLKSENPYHYINLPNANNIRINSIRDLVSKIYLSSPAGNTKVFLISEADKMRQEASNALLKILEEPPKNSVIILTTSKVNSLPQTIIGRCQKIHFEPLAEEVLKQKLTETTNYAPKQVELASRLCFGSYTRASRLLDSGIEDIRDTALEFLISILKDSYADVIMICRKITAKNDRERTRNFLFFLNIWIRDLMRIRNLGEDMAKVINFDLIERLSRLNTNFPHADIFKIVLELEEADKLINQNVQLTLILVNLSFKLKKYFT